MTTNSQFMVAFALAVLALFAMAVLADANPVVLVLTAVTIGAIWVIVSMLLAVSAPMTFAL